MNCQRQMPTTRSLFETSLDPLATISMEGKITDVNTATERITGYAGDELIGYGVLLLFCRAS